MSKKIIYFFVLCSVLLITPVFGYNEVDNPKDYCLTELPSGYEWGCYADYVEENDYYQSFSRDNGGQIYVTIYTFPNNEVSTFRLRNIISGIKNNNDGYSSYIVNENYGIGDEAYATTKTIIDTGTKFETFYFTKNHIIIDVHAVDGTSTQAELMKFAKLYENKIDSVLENAPQIFASIELERGAGATYLVGDKLIYHITISEDAYITIENQVNNGNWHLIEGGEGFYRKGQHTLYNSITDNVLGNEKLKLTATSLKGISAISTVSYFSEYETVTVADTVPQEIAHPPPEQSPGFNTFSVLFSFFVVYCFIKK